jgi:hypothetical protein
MASTKYSHAVLLINFFHLSQERLPAEGLRGRGYRGDPLGGARDWTLRRYDSGIFSHSPAMVFENLQIAN